MSTLSDEIVILFRNLIETVIEIILIHSGDMISRKQNMQRKSANCIPGWIITFY